MSNHPSRFNPANRYIEVLWTDEERHEHSHDLIDAQRILGHRVKGVADALMSDGNVVSGGAIVVDKETGLVRLAAAHIYANGIVHDVPAATFTVPVNVTIAIGLCVTTQIVTYIQDPDLKGFAAGTHAFGEPGADRLKVTSVWAPQGSCSGTFYAVYTVVNGVVLTQTPPPAFDGFNSALARYDRESNGHYIVNGWRVSGRGLNADGAQVFSIQEGTINAWGYKIDRLTAYPLAIPEDPDLEEVEAEPHVVASNHNPATPLRIFLNRTPVATIDGVTVLKQVSETVTHGPFSGVSDALANNSVAEIVSVVQGGTTYTNGVHFFLEADHVNWSPAGSEPAPGSTYTVVYRYLDVTAPDSHDGTSITVSNATPSSTVIVRYHWKLPRIDVITVDRRGLIGYTVGVSSRYNPVAPVVPGDIFAIAEVTNNWGAAAGIRNTLTRTVHTNRLQQFGGLIDDLFDLVAQERLKRDAERREVVAKRGLFVDPFHDDDMRDQGLAQTAAVYGGAMRLPIAATITAITLPGPLMLPAISEVLIRQELATGCFKINEYQLFAPMPGRLSLTPAVDFWVDYRDVWASDVTRVFEDGSMALGQTIDSATVEEVARVREDAATMRVRSIDFAVTGLGAGEILDRLTFDGVDVTPAPNPVANGSGTVTGSFTIPTGLTTGAKRVEAEGRAGLTPAVATYIGTGIVDIRTLRNVYTQITGTFMAAPFDNGLVPVNAEGGGSDPLAQTFVAPQGRHLDSISVCICEVGNPDNPVFVQIREVRLGVPTAVVLAEAEVDMHGRSPGEWVTAPYSVPVYVPGNTEYAFVFMTDDGNHKLKVGELGQFDAINQRWVTEQPYGVGVLLSSANTSTWTPHQKVDLTFRLNALRFAATERIVDAGDVALAGVTDLIVLAAVDLPAVDTSCMVQLTRASGEVTLVRPGQPIRFDAALTETVNIKFVLRGTAIHSPTLFPFIQVVKGVQASTGTYISRAATAGASSRVLVTVDTLLPGSAALDVKVGQTSGNYQSATLVDATPLGDGWQERTYAYHPWSQADVRVFLTETGTPADRPLVKNLRMLVTDIPANITGP